MDKIAIITGASSGLGREISLQLAKKNYHLILIARNNSGLDETRKKIKKIKKKCTIMPLDITQQENIEKLKKHISILGKVEVIVNNAGIGIFDKIEDIQKDDWDNQISTNLTSAFLLTQSYIKIMKKNKKGVLIFINSIAGKKGYPFSSAYVASKYALRGFANSIREELRDFNIKVISIFPGAIDTPFWNNVNTDYPREQMMTSKEVAIAIIDTIKNKGVAVVEELVIRRNKGDF